ncbi:exosporium glycoprotein BclB-related protein [Psychrobacillus sp. NPDC093180]|uniref:exosporium glycoprotein BclB-related protein n=1 Tax=Psychrobacillus sp. NPDC093180 TaxID=3364489 RepID=UPI00382A2581
MCCNNSQCNNGCNFGRCTNLGPFVAVDADCIIPPAAGARSSVIPFSSGIVTPIALVTTAGGLASTVSTLGFGSALTGISLVGGLIDVTGLASSEAFTVPRAGNVTAISANFNTLLALTVLTGTATIRAQIFRAPAGSNIFSPTAATVLLAPPLTAPLAAGQLSSGSASGFSVPVAPGDRLLMVFSVTATGLTAAVTVTGFASAGITID